LTGVGGVGKTRLALEVGAELVPEFRDGVWLVELAGVRDHDSVPDVVMATFGVQPSAGLSASEALVAFLQDRTLLLIVDNCEHLLRPVATLIDDVVRHCQRVRVLATSREGLNVAGERMLGVASLDVPDETLGLAAIAQCDAVALFVERARAVKAGFVLDETNAQDVAQICVRLDGIALAIELAAARVAMLTPSELARRLDQRFRLLAGGQRSAVERHQTLRAAVDWSYELLSEPEQILLARLSVFVGGFSLEAAESVGAGGTVPADGVFDALAALVARSLVVADTEGVDTRYRLLETIRQYAQERIDDSGEEDRLRDAHAAYFADFGENAIPRTLGSDGMEWEERIKREFDNLRSAITWAIDTRNATSAMRLIGMWDAAPTFTASMLGLVGGVLALAQEAVELPGAAEQDEYPAALTMAATAAVFRGDQDLAREQVKAALAAEARRGTQLSIGPWGVLANIALARGEAEDAVEYGRRGVEVARERGDPVWLAHALAWLCVPLTLRGDAAEAAATAEEVLALTPRLARTHAVTQTLAYAAFALGKSDPERALDLVRELVQSIPPGEPNTNWAFAGDLAAQQGQVLEALGYFDKVFEAFRWFGQRVGMGVVLGRVGVLLADADPEAAAVLHGAGEMLVPSYSHAEHHVEARRQALEKLSASLGDARLAELQSQGAAMTDAEIIDYAHAAISRALTRPQIEREVRS
jgi:predicted ATPase